MVFNFNLAMSCAHSHRTYKYSRVVANGNRLQVLY